MSAFQKLVRLDEVQVAGFERRLEPNEAERAAIAKRLGIPAVNHLTGDIALKRIAGGFDLIGHFDAVLDRICVSSLDPVSETLSEDFAICFSRDAIGDAAEIEIDADAPEPLPEEGFDLVEILVQQLALAMDPYPHKEGARPLAAEFGKTGDASPFEALKGAFAARRDKE